MKQATSFLKLTDLKRPQLASMLEETLALKTARGSSPEYPLKGQTWALLFHKSSTRTRVSFEVGIHELGGHAMILDQKRMQTGRGETIEDTARVLSRYVHGLIIRTYDHSIVEDFASFGSVPVINALTDALHPCQVLSDLFTLAERWGEPGQLLACLSGKKVAFFGDCRSNMAHSWILGAALADMKLCLCGPEGFQPDSFVDDLLETAGLTPTYEFSTDAGKAASAADAVYTDVWVSMGDEEQSRERVSQLQPYQVDDAVMATAKPDAFFLHCLPAHVGEEVAESVYRSTRSIVFDQAENRLHAQKAILKYLAETANSPPQWTLLAKGLNVQANVCCA